MAYALLIIEPPGQREAHEEQGKVRYARMVEFSEQLRKRGLLTLSQSLASDRDGARVQVHKGQATILDGPFAEARELIGGFLLLTCQTRAQAIAIASECPAVHWATVEVRELGPCFT